MTFKDFVILIKSLFKYLLSLQQY